LWFPADIHRRKAIISTELNPVFVINNNESPATS
jgi:hypothetical protein